MRWAQELASSLQPDLDSVNRLASRFEASLSEAERSEDLHDLLRAGSILLRAGALKGELILPRLDHVPSGLQEPNAPSSSTAVLGLGVAGRETLSAFLPAGDGQGRIARFLFDLEASRACELDASIIGVVLQLPFPDPRDSGGGSGVPRYPEMLRAAYRGAAGPKGLPRILSESLFEPGSRRTMVHVVADIEDPWVVLLPELLSDLRAFFGFGARGRVLLHLVARPFPRVKGSFRDVLLELERTRPFDEAFLVSGNDGSLALKVERFVSLSAIVPDLLLPKSGPKERGAFSSFGMASAPPACGEKDRSSRYLRRFEDAFQAALPSALPADAVFSELFTESVHYIHPPQAAPPDCAWRLCPEMIPVSVSSVEPTLCRIQRGLRLADLRLFS